MAERLTATYRRNNDLFRAEFRDDNGIISAVKRFEVNSDDPVDGAKADGLPRRGDPYAAAWPDVVCTGVEYERIGGSNKIDNGDQPATGGWSVWKADYKSRAAALGVYIFDGLRYTKEEWQVDKVTLYHGLRAQDRARRIKNGDGVDVDVGQQAIKVLRYGKVSELEGWYRQQRTRIARMVRKQVVNSDDVRLPPLYGSAAAGDEYAPGTLRMHGFRRDYRGGLLELEWTLLHAPIPEPPPGGTPSESGWFFAWQPEDSQGKAVGEPVDAQIYETGPFAGLWG